LPLCEHRDRWSDRTGNVNLFFCRSMQSKYSCGRSRASAPIHTSASCLRLKMAASASMQLAGSRRSLDGTHQAARPRAAAVAQTSFHCCSPTEVLGSSCASCQQLTAQRDSHVGVHEPRHVTKRSIESCTCLKYFDATPDGNNTAARCISSYVQDGRQSAQQGRIRGPDAWLRFCALGRVHALRTLALVCRPLQDQHAQNTWSETAATRVVVPLEALSHCHPKCSTSAAPLH
jgi:hypothetical protein